MVIGRRALLLAGIGIAVWPAGAGAVAAPEQVRDAEAFIRQLGANAIEVLRQSGMSLEERERRFRALLAQGFAMEFIARFVLGRHWNAASEEQRQDYVQLFTEYVLRTYSSRLGGYAGEDFAVTGGRPAGKQDILVQTRIDRPSASDITADWRVRAFDGELKIIDIMVEGVSMAVTQRSEFAAVVNRDGIEGLLQALRARTQRFPAASS